MPTAKPELSPVNINFHHLLSSLQTCGPHYAANGTLTDMVRLFNSLTRHAERIFCEIYDEVVELNRKAKVMGKRTERLMRDHWTRLHSRYDYKCLFLTIESAWFVLTAHCFFLKSVSENFLKLRSCFENRENFSYTKAFMSEHTKIDRPRWFHFPNLSWCNNSVQRWAGKLRECWKIILWLGRGATEHCNESNSAPGWNAVMSFVGCYIRSLISLQSRFAPVLP